MNQFFLILFFSLVRKGEIIQQVMRFFKQVITLVFCWISFVNVSAQDFVQRKGHQFYLKGQPYYYAGANYWYGGLLSLPTTDPKGIERLRKELDFLRSEGITNVRVMAGAEGSGPISGVPRVNPPLQPSKGNFDASALKGLDILLVELDKRKMKAVLFLSNNWEWTGGFLQYLNWNGLLQDSVLRRKLSWDEQRDYVSRFYTCPKCKEDYLKQVRYILDHVNSVNGRKYINEPAIMAWELANEPRPMRPAANDAYQAWVSSVAAFIKSKDINHLITTGHEGEVGTENMQLFESVHADSNIDYLTIHIWPKNWGWFKEAFMEADFSMVISKTKDYITRHMAVAQKLQKPLVVEEFGLPRDGHSFDVNSKTVLRDQYYNTIFSYLKNSADIGGVIGGVNFWAFAGIARPIKGQVFWKKGDDFMGDPPMEEQGLNSVFDRDSTTWNLIYHYKSGLMHPQNKINNTADTRATKETRNLYASLKKLLVNGILFGHQDDLAYGVGWKYIDGKSDIKEVTNDYPAVYGWELGNIEHELPYNLDSVPFDKMRKYIRQGYDRGGVITLSWHADSPVYGESAWDTTHGAVQSILPGGNRHELYQSWLDKIADFMLSLKGKNGELIPVLFRPFHELTGNWFWWCRNTCTPVEYKLLWRFTIDYLRNTRKVNNLIYVYNTADFDSREGYLERYPGDDVVDIVSFDAYQYGDPRNDSSFLKNVDRRLTILEEIAREKNKIPALAETGYEAIPYAEWWTNTLWKAIGDHKISYVLAWRNHGLQPGGHMHYYAPFRGQVSAKDFQEFYKLKRTLFQSDITKQYLYK
jgi:mannan endo-1,4-beta-mannosidase